MDIIFIQHVPAATYYGIAAHNGGTTYTAVVIVRTADGRRGAGNTYADAVADAAKQEA